MLTTVNISVAMGHAFINCVIKQNTVYEIPPDFRAYLKVRSEDHRVETDGRSGSSPMP